MAVAIGKGHDIIGSLKAACLLEDGHRLDSNLKMHKIVRELALWIARGCGKNENEYLVQAGVGLSQTPEIKGWKDAKRISLMGNDLRELTGTPECARLATLMLQRNRQLSVIPDDFFQNMPNLQVLDLSKTSIRNLPKSIGCLLELRYLNLSETRIETLPSELRNLVKLKYLNLWGTYQLASIPHEVISCLSRLQVLHLWSMNWDGQIEAELEALQQLRMLHLFISKLSAPQGMLLSQRLQSCLEILVFRKCSELIELALMLSLHLGKTKILSELDIHSCDNFESLIINSLEEDNILDPLETSEKLSLFSLPKLSCIIWVETTTHLHFRRLTKVRIWMCNALKDILWLVLAPSLRVLDVSSCSALEEIIVDKFAAVTIEEDQNALSRLVEMFFSDLPKLKSIVRSPFSFPCLQSIRVSRLSVIEETTL